MESEHSWLTAIRAGITGRRLIGLVTALGDIDAVVGANPEALRKAGLKAPAINALRQPDAERLAADMAWLAVDGHDFLPFDDPRYPALLGRIPAPPAGLFVVGDPAVLWQPQVALVGSRNPTRGGLDHARDFSQELTRMGFVITSGMAAGIDSAAHQAALAAGGSTIAVLGTGPDQVYPAANRELAGRIARQGVLVTELPPGSPAKRQHFPARNRIISGLSLGVLVIEAGLNSGSLITARLAAEQGREAFALPGSLHNPLSKGCHRLIKQGAKLVESTSDIVDELAPVAGDLAAALRHEIEEEGRPARVEKPDATLLEDEDYARLWAAIGFDPRPVDELIESSGILAQEVSSMLLMLELHGLVQFQPGGRVARCA